MDAIINIKTYLGSIIKYRVNLGNYELCNGTLTGIKLDEKDNSLRKVLRGILNNIDNFKEFYLFNEINLIIDNIKLLNNVNREWIMEDE